MMCEKEAAACVSGRGEERRTPRPIRWMNELSARTCAEEHCDRSGVAVVRGGTGWCTSTLVTDTLYSQFHVV